MVADKTFDGRERLDDTQRGPFFFFSFGRLNRMHGRNAKGKKKKIIRMAMWPSHPKPG
jgi:hypothetical protein